MAHIVHENGYRDRGETELQQLCELKMGNPAYSGSRRRFCDRKYNSDLSREMSRSVRVYLEDFLHK